VVESVVTQVHNSRGTWKSGEKGRRGGKRGNRKKEAAEEVRATQIIREGKKQLTEYSDFVKRRGGEGRQDLAGQKGMMK